MATIIGQTMMDSKREQYIDTALRRIAADTRETAPEPRRVDRGLLLALNRHVEIGPDEAFVQSDSDPEVQYCVRAGMCDCVDWANAPEHLCKHIYSVMFTIAARQEVR